MKSKATNASNIGARTPGSSDKFIAKVRQLEAKDGNERLEKLEEERRSLEEEMREKAAAVDNKRKRVNDAGSIAGWNEARAKECEEKASSCVVND